MGMRVLEVNAWEWIQKKMNAGERERLNGELNWFEEDCMNG